MIEFPHNPLQPDESWMRRALDQARRAIASGEVDTAIVGSVNVLLSPMPFIGFSKASMLSATRRRATTWKSTQGAEAIWPAERSRP